MRKDGPGWGAAALLFACGVALGSLVVRAPVRQRLPYVGAQPLRKTAAPPFPLPELLPFYAAALALPLFLVLARRTPLSRETWMRATPLWAGAVLALSLLPELALFLWMGGRPGSLAVFLGMRLLGTGPLVLGSAALAHAIEHRRRARVSEAELTEARLAALTAQLRPHFLFNTLQSVSTLVHRDPEAADAMIGRLGELLRASLEAADTPLIPLEEELRLTAAYLEIMRERFGERLRFSIEADGDTGALVPPLLLQPVVENAVRHGIEPRREGGEVRVRVAAGNGEVVLEVTNTGGGETIHVEPGIGLGNTRQRLHALYGGAAELSFHSDGESGTRVVFRIPGRRSHAQSTRR